ncbi:MAG: hypothetical protein QG617_868, partial [Campylobacterota bacterium]|nr:hypothetical protein [Campylobacterota bacterium]
TNYNSNNDFALARYNSDGSLDTTFNSVNTLNGTLDYIENGSPVILDNDVQIYDAELSALGNYGGATLTLARDGGANSEDQFSGAGIVAGQANGDVVVSATTVGTYIYSPGYLTITFNTNATQSLVNQAMQSITYSNSSDTPPANVQIDWFFSDGNTGMQGAGGALMISSITTINITAVNDAPTSADTTVSTNENTFLNMVLPNAIDLDGDIVAYTLKSNPYHGTVSIQTNGSYTYTPDSNFSGIDLFTYTVSDENGGSNSYIVKVDVLETGYVPLPTVEGVNLSNVAKLYVATFNRAPDTLGLDYWVYQSGLGIEQIAQSFFDQPETKALYPTGTSNTSFVTSVYDNLFNRAPDQAGLDYWVHELDTGSIAKQNFILAVINGAQDTEISFDITILTNKMNIGLFFAQEDLDNVDDAKLVMENVSAVSSSVEDALSLITDMTTQEFLAEDMASLANLISLDTYSGDLSIAALRTQVIAQTGSDAYYAAFDPINYEGSADGVFTAVELGLPNFENLPATVETIESLFYGTIIKAYKAVDVEEATSINSFITANQSGLEAENETTFGAYINLMVSIFSDPASPSIFSDPTIAEMTVSAGSMFVEIVGTNSIPPALFDGVLLGFMG